MNKLIVSIILMLFVSCSPEDLGRSPEPGWQYWSDDFGTTVPERPFDLALNDNQIWVASETGIFSFDGITWIKYDSLRTQNAVPQISYHTIDISNDGTIWVGGTNGTVVRFNKTKWENFPEATQLISSVTITAIVCINNDEVWIGTESSGLLHYHNSTWEHWEALDSLGLPSNMINDLLLDYQGVLWVATDNGLIQFDGQEWKLFSTISTGGKLPDNYITSLAQDSTHHIWLGTQQGYLVKYDQKEWIVYSPNDSTNELPGVPILGLAVDQNNNKWLGFEAQDRIDPNEYREGGVMKFTGSTWVRYTTFSTASGMPSNYVRDIQVDEKNHKWFAIGGGVTRYSKE